MASCEELARAVDSYEAALRNEAQHAAEGATLMIHPGFLALFPLTVPIAAVAIVQHHHFVAVLRAGQAEARRLMRDKGCAAKPDPAPNQPAESQANRPEPQ